MLSNNLCNGGLLDYRSIEHINEQCNCITPIDHEDDIGNIKLPKFNIGSHPKLSHFAANRSHPDN
jgi:hypothetical protein